MAEQQEEHAKVGVSVLVMNGDLVTQADIGAMLDYHERTGNRITIAAKQYSCVVPYGCITLEGDRVARFEEKPIISRWVNTGIYVVNPEVVKDVPSEMEFPITCLLEKEVAAGGAVGAFEVSEDWLDVGQREHLKQAREGI